MSPNKRQEIKAQRQRRKREERMRTFLIVGGIMLILVALFISPYLMNQILPVGEIISITPQNRPMENGTAIGDPNAPVVIEVFTDFQCPSCRNFADSVEKSLVESDYIISGQAYYIFRQYPFIDRNSTGQESHQAANASMCAAEQGRFWDYHDILFANWNGENQGAFKDKRLIAFAEDLGLNMEQFNACFQDNKYESEIAADYNRGLQYGVTGTPTVFVNGELVVEQPYVPTYDNLAETIDALLIGG